MEDISKIPNRFFARILKLDYRFGPEIEEKLERSRIQTSVDLRNITDENLMKMYAFTAPEIQQIRKVLLDRKLKITRQNFFDPSLEEKFITTGCQMFDEILGGKGVGIGRITQLSGTAGAGKTQFCLKLCLTVQLDKEHGGLEGEALYLETEDCFRPDRAMEIAGEIDMLKNDKNVLKRIHCFSRFDKKLGSKFIGIDHLIEILHGKNLQKFFDNHPSVRLFVIDSISYLFRYDYNGTEQSKLNQQMIIAKRLKYLATQYNLAIVITNQVKFSQELPSMGELWNSIPSAALLLRRTDTGEGFVREARVLKSISGLNDPNSTAFEYRITKSGIDEILMKKDGEETRKNA